MLDPKRPLPNAEKELPNREKDAIEVAEPHIT
jgi:hypothetical protein